MKIRQLSEKLHLHFCRGRCQIEESKRLKIKKWIKEHKLIF
uniref:Uncharacterized protein n=1 Tax=Meloidogyne enterolobii TaxID=390850 RepID=A0A6V7W8G0_MELEN|nr:unnamed protein product [Meloidogyne enterolobii]